VITPPELAREIADGHSKCELVIIEGACTLPPLEQPDAVNRALADWLKESATTSSQSHGCRGSVQACHAGLLGKQSGGGRTLFGRS